MLPMDALLGAGFILFVVGLAVATSERIGLDARAGLMERRNPAAATALRRAQAVHELRGGYGDECVGAVCTPSRRSWIEGARVRGSDFDPRFEVAEEQLPPMPATVVALASGEHVPPHRAAPAPRHPSRERVRTPMG